MTVIVENDSETTESTTRRETPTVGRRMLSLLTQRGALLILVVVAWELIALWLSARAIPRVTPVVESIVATVPTERFAAAVIDTLHSWALGLLIAAGLGIPSGFLLGASELATRLTRGVVEFMRTVPGIMLVPLAVLVFGSTIEMKVLLIALSAMWPILIHAAYGIRHVDGVARDTAGVFKITPWQRVAYLYVPSALPVVATGLRVAATVALMISIGCEIVTSAPGIGHEILLSQSNSDPARAFVFVLASGFVGVAINQAFGAAERRTMFWHAAHRAGSR